MTQCSSCGGDCRRGKCERANTNDPPAYWCVICLRPLPIVDGVIVHDDVPHPDNFDFNEMDRPQ